jgi:hypothetical protein
MNNAAATRLRSAWSALIVAYPDDEKIARAVLGEEVFAALHPLMLKEIDGVKDGIVGLEREVQPLRRQGEVRAEVRKALDDLGKEAKQSNAAPTGGSK